MTLTKQELAMRRQKLFHIVRQTPDFMRPHDQKLSGSRGLLDRARFTLSFWR